MIRLSHATMKDDVSSVELMETSTKEAIHVPEYHFHLSLYCIDILYIIDDAIMDAIAHGISPFDTIAPYKKDTAKTDISLLSVFFRHIFSSCFCPLSHCLINTQR